MTMSGLCDSFKANCICDTLINVQTNTSTIQVWYSQPTYTKGSCKLPHPKSRCYNKSYEFSAEHLVPAISWDQHQLDFILDCIVFKRDYTQILMKNLYANDLPFIFQLGLYIQRSGCIPFRIVCHRLECRKHGESIDGSSTIITPVVFNVFFMYGKKQKTKQTSVNHAGTSSGFSSLSLVMSTVIMWAITYNAGSAIHVHSWCIQLRLRWGVCCMV